MAVGITKDHHNFQRALRLNGNYVSNDGNNEGLSVDNSGHVILSNNLGIGTSSPDVKLDVDAGFTGDDDQTDIAYFRTYETSAFASMLTIRGGRDVDATTHRFLALNAYLSNESTTTALVLNEEGGRVGIGTSVPAAGFEVRSTVNPNSRFAYSDSAYLNLQISADSSAILSTALEGEIHLDAGGDIKIDAGATKQITFRHDDVIFAKLYENNGSWFTMYEDTDGGTDSFQFFVGLHGATSMITTDNDGSAADFLFNIDGQIQFQTIDFAGYVGNGEDIKFYPGKDVKIIKEYRHTADIDMQGLSININKIGASEGTNNIYGLNIDLDNITAISGANTMYGINCTPTLTHAADAGTSFLYGARFVVTGNNAGSTHVSSNIGLSLTTTGADINNGIVMVNDNAGKQYDLRIGSGDNFQILSVANGATTISTTDAGADKFAHLTVDVDGDIVLDAVGDIVLDAGGKVGIGEAAPVADLEIKGNLSTALTGTVTVVNSNANITGSGTNFDNGEIQQGDAIKIVSAAETEEVFTVVLVTDDTHLTLDGPYLGVGASGLTAYTDSNLFDVRNGDDVSQFEIDNSGKMRFSYDADSFGELSVDDSGSVLLTSSEATGSYNDLELDTGRYIYFQKNGSSFFNMSYAGSKSTLFNNGDVQLKCTSGDLYLDAKVNPYVLVDGASYTPSHNDHIANKKYVDDTAGAPEGTAVLSTGETGTAKFLRVDGDNSSSWALLPLSEGTSILSTGPITDGYVLTAVGDGTSAWEAAPGAGGGIDNVVEDTTPELGGNMDAGDFNITNVNDLNVDRCQIGGGAIVSNIYDEDSMAHDSNTGLCTQQSIKAYVDTEIAGAGLGVVAQTIVTISEAEMDALHTTEKELVAAQGVGITIIPLHVWMFVDRDSNQGNNADMHISWNGGTSLTQGTSMYFKRWMWNESGDRTLQMVPFIEVTDSVTGGENRNLTAVLSAAITSGSITEVKVVTIYTTCDVS